MGAWGEGSDVAICRVDGFGAGGCAFGWESRPAENEENFTFYWKKERIAQGLQNTLFWKKCHCLKIAQDQEGSCP